MKLTKTQKQALEALRNGSNVNINHRTLISLFVKGLIRPAKIDGVIPFPHNAKAWEIVE